MRLLITFTPCIAPPVLLSGAAPPAAESGSAMWGAALPTEPSSHWLIQLANRLLAELVARFWFCEVLVLAGAAVLDDELSVLMT